jgi:hypothetical protein
MACVLKIGFSLAEPIVIAAAHGDIIYESCASYS